MLWIGAKQESCYEDVIEIDVSDNLTKIYLVLIVQLLSVGKKSK